MLRLRRSDLQKIYDQARDEHPAECCGLLTADSPGSVSAVHPCENIQGRLHDEDPESYPRDSRIAYFIDPKALLNIVSAIEKSGGVVSGFYHSHIDCEAYFSEEDKERAMAWDEPAYPHAAYLVVSVCGDGARNFETFAWDESTRDFVTVKMEIVEDDAA